MLELWTNPIRSAEENLAIAQGEITQLRQQLATQKAYYESVFEDGAKRIRSLTENLDVAVEALSEIVERIKGHPAYEELSEYEECEVGGDTAEFSYLGRIGDAALAAIKSSEQTK